MKSTVFLHSLTYIYLINEETYRHVLLADDDHDDCDFFEEAFSSAFPKIKLSISNDGGKLMDLLNKPPEPLADLIFLDLNMPVKSGPECLKEIRSHKVLSSSIVIIFSTSSNPFDIESMYELGANYFITKPNNYNDLKKLIEKGIFLAQKTGTLQPSFNQFYISA